MTDLSSLRTQIEALREQSWTQWCLGFNDCLNKVLALLAGVPAQEKDNAVTVSAGRDESTTDSKQLSRETDALQADTLRRLALETTSIEAVPLPQETPQDVTLREIANWHLLEDDGSGGWHAKASRVITAAESAVLVPVSRHEEDKEEETRL